MTYLAFELLLHSRLQLNRQKHPERPKGERKEIRPIRGEETREARRSKKKFITKDLPAEVDALLAHIYNDWLQNGEVNHDTNIASGTMLYKKGDINDPENYRMIESWNLNHSMCQKSLTRRINDCCSRGGSLECMISQAVALVRRHRAKRKAIRPPLRAVLCQQVTYGWEGHLNCMIAEPLSSMRYLFNYIVRHFSDRILKTDQENEMYDNITRWAGGLDLWKAFPSCPWSIVDMPSVTDKDTSRIDAITSYTMKKTTAVFSRGRSSIFATKESSLIDEKAMTIANSDAGRSKNRMGKPGSGKAYFLFIV